MARKAAKAAPDDLKEGSSDTATPAPELVPRIRVMLGDQCVADTAVFDSPDEPTEIRTLAEDLEERIAAMTDAMMQALLSHSKELQTTYRLDPYNAAMFKLQAMGSLIAGVLSAWRYAHPEVTESSNEMIRKMFEAILSHEMPGGFIIRMDRTGNLIPIPYGYSALRH